MTLELWNVIEVALLVGILLILILRR